MSMKHAFLCLALFAVLAGCQNGSSPAVKANDAPSGAGAPVSAAEPEPKSEEPAAAPGSEPAEPSRETIPAELRHDAYRYYGFDRETPMAMEMRQEDSVQEGTVSFRFKGLQNGRAVFAVERTGGLSAMGNEEMAVDEKGVHSLGTSLGKIKSQGVEMPPRLAPGVTWKTSHEIELATGGSMKDVSTYKVVRVEKVKTPVGEHEALLIVSEGSATLPQGSSPMRARMWFVKDRGLVKMEMRTMSEGRPLTMTMQETR